MVRRLGMKYTDARSCEPSARLATDLPPPCEGIAALAATAAWIAADGGGRETCGAEDAKWDSIHAVTWASRATSEPSGPLGGRAPWQIGHSSSSGRSGWTAPRAGSGASISIIGRGREEVEALPTEVW